MNRLGLMEFVCCALCGSNDYQLYHRAVGYSGLRYFVVRCQECGLVYVNPRLSEAEIKCARQQLRKEDAASAHENEGLLAAFEVYKIQRHVSQGRVLDIGAGWGVFLAQAKNQGFEVWGTELYVEGIQQAEDKLGIKIMYGPVEELQLPQDYFEAIHCSHVLEHIPRPSLSLSRIYQLLKPGGLLVVRTPNLECRKERKNIGSTLEPTVHLTYFTPHTLRRLLEKSGFHILRVSTGSSGLGYLIRHFGLLIRHLPLRLLFALTLQLEKWTYFINDQLEIYATK